MKTDAQLIVVGPLPPPLNGMTVMTSHILAGLRAGDWQHIHLDTSDHRGVGKIGTLDVTNIWLALGHAMDLLFIKGASKSVLYLPIAQGSLGFLRDALLICIARLRRIPVVIHLHGAGLLLFFESALPPMRWIIRWCLGRAERAIVLGPSLVDAFGDLVPASRVRVVRNGIPGADRVPDRSRKRGRVTILFLSNMRVGKGYQDVIEAARLIVEDGLDAQFVLAGEWPDPRKRDRVLAQVHDLGMESRVAVVGRVDRDEKCKMLSQADIFVFPPRQLEGQPVVLIEAMSYGLPIVSTPRGGIVDLVEDGRTGILVPPGNPEGLASGIRKLIVDPNLRLRMGNEGRRIFESMHTIECMRAALEAAITGGNAPPPVLSREDEAAEGCGAR